jgi:hypothetical protein
MNKIAKALFIIGWVCIASGIILAFTNYQTVVGYEESIILDPEPIVEKSFIVLISYVIGGVILGIMMFGFAEIVKLLDIIASKFKVDDVSKPGKETKFDRFIQDTLNK